MIEVRELTKRFPLADGSELTAVDAVSFSVSPGTVYGLLGANGAGKTTTLRMLLGLLSPTSGNATIDGFRSDIYPDEVKRRVGLVSANAGLYQYLSPREMLLFFADLYGASPQAAQAELERLAKLFALSEFIDRPCAQLSTGQRQRVTLARALIHRPPILLLDEPTLGLDVLGTRVITEFIDHLKQSGKAVILCTHHLDEAERICSRFGLMDRGKIAAEGTLAELQQQTGCSNLIDMFMKISVRGPVLSSAVG